MSIANAYAAKKRSMLGAGKMPEGESAMNLADDIVDRIMAKRMGDEPMKADEMSADFDVSHQRPLPPTTNSGAAAGDFLGNAEQDMERDDIIAMIMKKRAKQHNPSPA